MEKQNIKDRARGVLSPLISLVDALGLSPLLVTTIGLLVSLYGALVTARGSLFWGGVFLLIAGLCDVIDGSLARKRGAESTFGAFFDSVSDRVTEFAYFGAIGYYLVFSVAEHPRLALVVTLTALAGSVLTSYARARAEGVGLTCYVGLLERPERITLLVVGLLLGRRLLMLVLMFLAAATVITFFQRIYHVYRSSR